jgi:nitrous oxide reductase accessory protein NosL
MKKLILALVLIFGASSLYAQNMHQGKKMPKMFQSVPFAKATILQDGKAKMFCPKCGMNLVMFYKTNHAAKKDSKVYQYCSIHCLLADMDDKSKLQDIKVVDTNSLKFIDANKAYYVVGSSKKGTMSMVSKYAFASKEEAMEFANKFGGEVTDFEGALKAAKEGIDKDNQMIAKKQSMMAKKGEMIYNKKCPKDSPIPL